MTISSVKVAPEAEVMDRSGAVYYTGPPPMVVTGVPFYPGMQPSLPYPIPVPIPTAQQVPWKMVMDRSSLFDGVTMKQTTKGCMRLGPCQPNMEWTAHEYTHSYGEGDAIEDKLYLMEDAPYFGRCTSMCCPGGRPTRFDVWAGGVPNDKQRPPLQDRLFYFEKERTHGVAQCIGCDDKGNAIMVPCCCHLPYLRSHDHTGQVLGTTQFICDEFCFVPKFFIKDKDNQNKFLLRQETCCCGCIPMFKCGGKGGKCCSIPFYIRDPNTGKKLQGMNPGGGEGDNIAEVTHLWSGAKTCCERDNYAVNFPVNSSQEDKINIMGATLLVDVAFFEQSTN